ncbi:phosphomannomutase [Neorhizobium galegae]|uniref:phosphomannomutase n=1 Tax=Neorhizobium galegae TaxID=399 RepID=UPI001AE61ADE|nr:phosphomannomutase [Neorhizobium galegae]
MKFGTSGLRGLVTELEGRASALYATAYAQYLLESGKAKPGARIFVAGDFRPSSPDIMATCIGALKRAGLAPIDCGAIPTPALALYAMTHGAASLMITGSHIPADRNGIKFYRPDGEIDKRDELAITALAEQMADKNLELTPGTAPSEAAEAEAMFRARNEHILPAGALAGLTIGVYQHSTVARDWLVSILEFYGAKVLALGRSDHFIPVDTEAVSEDSIALFKAWTAEHALDAVVSADGDGDRPLVTDETGLPLRGDLLGLIAAGFLGAKVVVTPVTSNSGIEATGDFRVIRTRVGSPFVIEGMQQALDAGETAVMGFEANGGLLTASSFDKNGKALTALPTRDSFLPVLATLYLAKSLGKSLSALAGDFRLPVAAADRLENFPVETSAALMARLRASPDNLALFLKPLGGVRSVSDVDGLRVTLEDGRIIHLRPSGNAPEMRCYVEAESEEAALALLQEGLALIRAAA